MLAPWEELDSLGLLFSDRLALSSRDATPGNCLTFASTGGDGTHFSFLVRCAASPEAGPVVMTVPMEFDRPNQIVARDLRHFLGLGLHSGYFVLEQLQYSFDTTFAELDRCAYEDELSENERAALALIASQFGAAPWRNHRQELLQLESEFPL